MVNKKLMTSLFNVKFRLEKTGCNVFYDKDKNPLSNPLPQYRYITDKVVHPKKNAYEPFPDLIYAGPDDDHLLIYTFEWSEDGIHPWNYENDIVEKDLTLIPCNWVEQKWRIRFVLPEITPIGSGFLFQDNNFDYEDLPPTIENISNGSIINSSSEGWSSLINTYGSNYLNNKFFYGTNNTSSDGIQHAVLRNDEGYACKWVDQKGNDFYFNTTQVLDNLDLHMEWKFQTWKFTIDYNTGPNRYCNDLTTSYLIKKGSTSIIARTQNENAIFEKSIEDNFSINTYPSGSSDTGPSYYMDGITSTFTAAGITSSVKVKNWYNEQGRVNEFNRATLITAPKTIYAKWVNTQDREKFIPASGTYDDGVTQTKSVWNSAIGTFTVPSFTPVMQCVVLGAGGNAQRRNGDGVTSSECAELWMSNPGGNAALSSTYTYPNDASKKPFNYCALGSETSYSYSYVREGNTNLVISYRGASGGSDDSDCRRFNLLDSDPEKNITNGKVSVLKYFGGNDSSSSSGSVGASETNMNKTGYSLLTNTGTKSQFKYARNNTYTTDRYGNTVQNYNLYEIWAHFYFYPDTVNFPSNCRHESRLVGYMSWVIVRSSDNNGDTYGWRLRVLTNSQGKKDEFKTHYYTQGAPLGGRNYYGKGGHGSFVTNYKPKEANRWSGSYGSGGYVLFTFPTQQ